MNIFKLEPFFYFVAGVLIFLFFFFQGGLGGGRFTCASCVVYRTVEATLCSKEEMLVRDIC